MTALLAQRWFHAVAGTTMDDKFWEDRASDADSYYNVEFAKFIKDLTVSLRCASVLEVGCNAGNDLRLFSESVSVNGVDANPKIIDVAKDRFSKFSFKCGSVTDLPYSDASVDIVFTHGFFNHLEDDKVDKGVAELFRVSKKYIANCELFGKDNILDGDTPRWGRNMYEKWLEYKVKIISNVEMHKDIDPEVPRFLLVRKLG